jgi:hypothetical protein
MNEVMSKPKLPDTYYVGWTALVDWLAEWGIPEWSVRKLVKAGTIPTHKMPKMRKRFFVPREIEERLGLGKESAA